MKRRAPVRPDPLLPLGFSGEAAWIIEAVIPHMEWRIPVSFPFPIPIAVASFKGRFRSVGGKEVVLPMGVSLAHEDPATFRADEAENLIRSRVQELVDDLGETLYRFQFERRGFRGYRGYYRLVLLEAIRIGDGEWVTRNGGRDGTL